MPRPALLQRCDPRCFRWTQKNCTTQRIANVTTRDCRRQVSAAPVVIPDAKAQARTFNKRLERCAVPLHIERRALSLFALGVGVNRRRQDCSDVFRASAWMQKRYERTVYFRWRVFRPELFRVAIVVNCAVQVPEASA